MSEKSQDGDHAANNADANGAQKFTPTVEKYRQAMGLPKKRLPLREVAKKAFGKGRNTDDNQ